jgi:hypothetical protein
MMGSGLLWQPLFEASAQTFVGAVSNYVTSRTLTKIFKKNHFTGAQDLWYRGIMDQNVGEGDYVTIDGAISCYVQVFPRNPYENARQWSQLYTFQGKIDRYMFQTLEFSSGSDATLRVGSVNGETIIGIYNQYAYIGEGIVGIVPTKVFLRAVPDGFEPAFVGKRVLLGGRLAKCPTQHGFVIQTMFQKAGITMQSLQYHKLWYLQVDWIKPYKRKEGRYYSLLGSPWAATSETNHQYLIAYGYLNDKQERDRCLQTLNASPFWKDVRVYFDDLDCPSQDLSFKKWFF